MASKSIERHQTLEQVAHEHGYPVLLESDVVYLQSYDYCDVPLYGTCYWNDRVHGFRTLQDDWWRIIHVVHALTDEQIECALSRMAEWFKRHPPRDSHSHKVRAKLLAEHSTRWRMLTSCLTRWGPFRKCDRKLGRDEIAAAPVLGIFQLGEYPTEESYENAEGFIEAVEKAGFKIRRAEPNRDPGIFVDFCFINAVEIFAEVSNDGEISVCVNDRDGDPFDDPEWFACGIFKINDDGIPKSIQFLLDEVAKRTA